MTMSSANYSRNQVSLPLTSTNSQPTFFLSQPLSIEQTLKQETKPSPMRARPCGTLFLIANSLESYLLMGIYIFPGNCCWYTILLTWCHVKLPDTLIDVKFALGIKIISFWFTGIHRCMLALYAQYFPEFCEKKSQAYYSDGIQSHNLCNSRAVSRYFVCRK